MLVVLRIDLHTPDEHPLDHREDLERIAVGDEDVGSLSGIETPQQLSQPEGLGGRSTSTDRSATSLGNPYATACAAS